MGGEDGYYTIKDGRWGALDTVNPFKNGIIKVAWKEKYDQGFEVMVEGEYNTRTGKIKAHFESSRRVSGTFELAPKPSVFRGGRTFDEHTARCNIMRLRVTTIHRFLYIRRGQKCHISRGEIAEWLFDFSTV